LDHRLAKAAKSLAGRLVLATKNRVSLAMKGKLSMPTIVTRNSSRKKETLFSLDLWAVIVALALALAVKSDILKNVPW